MIKTIILLEGERKNILYFKNKNNSKKVIFLISTRRGLKTTRYACVNRKSESVK